jgi:Uma2 family endonuclease
LRRNKKVKDRHTKYSLYQNQGIKYYIIVDPDAKEAEVYQFENGQYILQQKGENFNFSFQLEDCSAVVNFGEIW